jgi:hypothetical protein
MIFLGETSASNVATVDLNGYFTSSYDYYQIYLDSIYVTTNGANIRMQFATTGSYTVQTSLYYSALDLLGSYNGGQGAGSDGNWNSTSMVITAGISSTSTNTSNAVITIFNPMSSNYKSYMSSFDTATTNIQDTLTGTSAGRWKDTTAITGVRFFPNAGNIYARKIRIYGIKNS